MHSNVASLRENWTLTTTESNVDDMRIVGALDQPIAGGLRLWMLLAMVFGVLLMMMIIVCCFIKIRIPRTKREIELDAVMRRKKKLFNAVESHTVQTRTRGSTKVIVMSSLPPANQSLLSTCSGGMECDPDAISNVQRKERGNGKGGKMKM